MGKFIKPKPPIPPSIEGVQLTHSVVVNISEHSKLGDQFDEDSKDVVLHDCIDDLENILGGNNEDDVIPALEVVIGDLVALRDNLKSVR